MRAFDRDVCSGGVTVNIKTATIEIAAASERIRARLGEPHDPARAAHALAAVLARWREPRFAIRRSAAARIAVQLGFSAPLVDASLDALVEPFTIDALTAFAESAPQRRELLGFIMAGNAPGAGLHEIVIALIAGAGVAIKTATAEPHFYAHLKQSIAEFDAGLSARIEVFNWGREDRDLTAALAAAVDAIVAYGDDATIEAIGGVRTIGFGSKLSGAIVTGEALRESSVRDAAAGIVRDVTLFEQLGCLSPHHVFVEDRSGRAARYFAHAMVDEIAALSVSMPAPDKMMLEDAAALRRVREIARWRELGEEAIELFEGPRLEWAVIYDRDASFRPSPGFRTVSVSPFRDREDLLARLAPAAGRLEAFSIAGRRADRAVALAKDLEALGVTYVAAPGAIQSPPLRWRHGGGIFLDTIMAPGAFP